MPEKTARKKFLPREQLDKIAAEAGFPVFLRRLEGLSYLFLYSTTKDENDPNRKNMTYNARTGEPNGKPYSPLNGHKKQRFNKPIGVLPAILNHTGSSSCKQYRGRGNVTHYNKADIKE